VAGGKDKFLNEERRGGKGEDKTSKKGRTQAKAGVKRIDPVEAK